MSIFSGVIDALIADGVWQQDEHAGRVSGRRWWAGCSPRAVGVSVAAPAPSFRHGCVEICRGRVGLGYRDLGGTVAGGTLWVAGGLTGGTATPTTAGYDPAIDTWKAGPDLPVALHHATAVTYRDEVVVLGGWSPAGGNPSAVVSDRVFALRGGGWTELPPLNRPRAAAAAAVVGDRIVVVGGQDGAGWWRPRRSSTARGGSIAAPLPTPREHRAAATDGTTSTSPGAGCSPRTATAPRSSGSIRPPGRGRGCRTCRHRAAGWARRCWTGGDVAAGIDAPGTDLRGPVQLQPAGTGHPQFVGDCDLGIGVGEVVDPSSSADNDRLSVAPCRARRARSRHPARARPARWAKWARASAASARAAATARAGRWVRVRIGCSGGSAGRGRDVDVERRERRTHR